MSLNPFTTSLQQAKEWLLARLHEGEKCPLCHQHAQTYRRKFNSGMAYALVLIYRSTKELNPPDGWLFVTKVFEQRKINANSIEYNKLKHWGFIEQADKNSDPNAQTPYTGMWRITPLGINFITQGISVPKYVYVYDNRVMPPPKDAPKETITFKEALTEKFDFNELMQGL